MKHSTLSKITSYLLITGLLLPLFIGFIHTLHHHEHVICHSKIEKHIHVQKYNCSSFHYFSDLQYKDALKNYVFAEPDYFNLVATQLNSLLFSTNIFSNFQRGPPSINDF